MPVLLSRFENRTLSIWATHGTLHIRFRTTLVGESANRLTYVLAWESLVDREVKWTGFLNGPEWVWVIG